ncbi:porin [Rouxiella badensis]|uniref:porin n=1 Tax=Rouxiella badensis TaxID=1646377 RepID=UPI002AD4B4C0|nr:porin [Rouxiella badensis]
MMMRKSLAVLISALVASSSVNAAEIYNKDSNKLDLYGKVVGLNYISSNSNEHGDKTYARFGFKGTTEISQQLSGYGQWEYNIKTNTPEESSAANAATRLAFAGLKFADFGSFDYGRNFGVLYDVEAWTDLNPEFGGDTWSRTDNFMSGRSNSLATLRTKDLFGSVNNLNFALQYQGKNEVANKPLTSNGEGWGMSSSYELGNGVSLAAAFAQSNRTEAQKADNNGNSAEAWTAGIKYDANQLYLAAMYAESKNMTPYGKTSVAPKTKNIELVAQYLFVGGAADGLRPSISYLQSTGQGVQTTLAADEASSVQTGNHALVKYIEVGTSYNFNKNMYTYVDYKINMLNKDEFTTRNGINTDNVLGLGLVYQF